ncbi:hypothetical protein NQZ68_011282 [Dissostichus eleginoides]|nr:hypothetical protein NQZ68_011282 [Dissostichus eleginoides]
MSAPPLTQLVTDTERVELGGLFGTEHAASASCETFSSSAGSSNFSKEELLYLILEYKLKYKDLFLQEQEGGRGQECKRGKTDRKKSCLEKSLTERRKNDDSRQRKTNEEESSSKKQRGGINSGRTKKETDRDCTDEITADS